MVRSYWRPFCVHPNSPISSILLASPLHDSNTPLSRNAGSRTQVTEWTQKARLNRNSGKNPINRHWQVKKLLSLLRQAETIWWKVWRGLMSPYLFAYIYIFCYIRAIGNQIHAHQYFCHELKPITWITHKSKGGNLWSRLSPFSLRMKLIWRMSQ